MDREKGSGTLSSHAAREGVTHGIFFVTSLMAILSLMSGTIRSSIVIVAQRQIARVLPFKYAIVGDSLAAECSWKWSFGFSPLSVINLAAGGSDIRGIARQVDSAHDFRPGYVLVSGGINDLILNKAPLSAIQYDFMFLLRRLRPGQKSVVTLIPYISDRGFASRIAGANAAIAELSSQRGISVVDINSSLSVDGARRPEMTTDGIHFSTLACSVWIKAVKSQISIMDGSTAPQSN